jgi:hypothetical protein
MNLFTFSTSLRCSSFLIFVFLNWKSFLKLSILKFLKQKRKNKVLYFFIYNPDCCFSWILLILQASFSFFRPLSLILLSLNSFSLSSPTFCRSSFFFWTKPNFSLVWVNICTVVVFFFFNLWRSSFLSSIFSFSVWFSILSCSKSIKCNPSANSSFFFRIFLFLARLFRSRRMSNLNSCS